MSKAVVWINFDMAAVLLTVDLLMQNMFNKYDTWHHKIKWEVVIAWNVAHVVSWVIMVFIIIPEHIGAFGQPWYTFTNSVAVWIGLPAFSAIHERSCSFPHYCGTGDLPGVAWRPNKRSSSGECQNCEVECLEVVTETYATSVRSGMYCVGLHCCCEGSHRVTCPGPLWIASHSDHSMLQWASALVIVFQVDGSLCSADYKCCCFSSRQADRHTEFFDCWRNCMFPLPLSLFDLRSELVHVSPPVTRDSRNSLPSSSRWKQSQSVDFCALPPDILVLGMHGWWYHSSSWQCCVHFWCKTPGQQIRLEGWLVTFQKLFPPPVLCLLPCLMFQADRCDHVDLPLNTIFWLAAVSLCHHLTSLTFLWIDGEF